MQGRDALGFNSILAEWMLQGRQEQNILNFGGIFGPLVAAAGPGSVEPLPKLLGMTGRNWENSQNIPKIRPNPPGEDPFMGIFLGLNPRNSGNSQPWNGMGFGMFCWE